MGRNGAMEQLWHDLLDTERQLRRAAENLARQWRDALFSVAATIAATDYENRLRTGTLPQTPDEAARWLISAQSGWRAAAQDGRLRQENARLAAETERLRQENARLAAETERLRQENARLAAETERLRQENARLAAETERRQENARLAAETERRQESPTEEAVGIRTSGETHPAPPLDVSGLMQVLAGIRPPPQPFQPEFFQKDGLLVAAIGRYGVSSRPRLAKTLAAALGVSPKAGSLTRCFDRVARLGLIRIHKEPGAPFSLISLTEPGKRAFRQMFAADPVRSEAELLLDAHPGSVTHAVLCAWAREFAEVAGYQVEVPGRSPVPGPAPDLVFRHGDRVLGVEVERALGGSDLQKWQAIARRGLVAVVAADRETAERIEATLAGQMDYLLTDFSYLVAEQPRTPELFWRRRSELASGTAR